MTVNGDSKSDGAVRPDAKPGRHAWLRLLTRGFLTRWRPIVLAVLVFGTTGFTAGWYYVEYRADRQLDNATAHAAIEAASEGTVMLLSYSPEGLNHDFDSAKSRVTNDFRSYYQQFTEQIVAPATQRAQLRTTVRVVRAAVSELKPNSAVVLAFIEQSTSSKEKPEPVKTSNSLRVMLKKIGGSWLIDKLDVL